MDNKDYWLNILDSRRLGYVTFKTKLKNTVEHHRHMLALIPESHLGLLTFELKHILEDYPLAIVHECLTYCVPHFKYNYEMSEDQTRMDRMFFSYLPKYAFKTTRVHGLFFSKQRSAHLSHEEALLVSYHMMKNHPEEWHYFMPTKSPASNTILSILLSEPLLHRVLFAVFLEQQGLSWLDLFFHKESSVYNHIPLLKSMHVAENIDNPHYIISHDYEMLKRFLEEKSTEECDILI